MMKAPTIDYMAFAPILATLAGSLLVIAVALVRASFVQRVVLPGLALVSLAVAAAFAVITWETGDQKTIIEGALAVDALALGFSLLVYAAGTGAIALSLRSETVRNAGRGEYYALLLASITGMTILVGAENLITLFVGFELLSIPLYVMCAAAVRDERSLESGLKYLIVGSVGSATLLYGLAMIYGATGSTDFAGISAAIGTDVDVTDPLLLSGVALAVTGLAFKASVAPFHQWTPDVYEGAPTPVTAFMAVATKVAAFGVFLRLFDDALLSAQLQWGPALAALCWVTILVGNLGAIGQSSLKRMLAWSGVAQAGYLLAGVVVGTRLGAEAVFFYLAVYLLMNVAAFAVVIARERVSTHGGTGERGDGLRSLERLGEASPWLAWPMTIAMLGLAGFPLTAGFFGKFQLINATVSGSYESLAIAIVIGSMISLVYYLRVVAMMWMSPREIEIPAAPGRRSRKVRAAEGWSPEAGAAAQPEVTAVAVICAALVLAIGIFPDPLFDVARDVGSSLVGFL